MNASLKPCIFALISTLLCLSGRPGEAKAQTLGQPYPDIAFGAAPEPSINGPRVVGSTPGRPFLFLIPATGEPPLEYAAENLPDGLTLDSQTGIITGSLKTDGKYKVPLTVRNRLGSDVRSLVIVGGKDKLALTPPMGWNSWNVWGTSVDAEKVKAAADWMVKSGLAAHGFQYVNIDDGWEGERDDDGVLQTNEKFGDMKALADYVHSKGLKLGIYSSPGPQTCAGYAGSRGYEDLDAATWAKWGIDYVKYDWCSYGKVTEDFSAAGLQAPYRLFRASLDKAERDIAYSLCQYGMGFVWTWGEQVGGNLWRTTGDITDTWSSLSSIGFGQSALWRHAGPGHWNDPDMLVVGKVGWGPTLHDTRLTPGEQVTHITLWSLLAAPLLIGADMSQLDDFTQALLTNDEVLDVDQDPLGRQARRILYEKGWEIWTRPLFDGTLAAGLFNTGEEEREIVLPFGALKLSGPQPVRDLWRKKDLGSFDGEFKIRVEPHGAAMVKVGVGK